MRGDTPVALSGPGEVENLSPLKSVGWGAGRIKKNEGRA